MVHDTAPRAGADTSSAAPLPLVPTLDEPRSDRVRQHVLDRAFVVIVVADDPGGKAGGEDMAVSVVAPVETLCVLAVEVVHARRELLGRGLDDEVVVRAHEAERVALPVMPSHDHGEQVQEPEPVGVVDEREPAEHGARGDVEDAVRKVAATDSRHSATVDRDRAGLGRGG